MRRAHHRRRPHTRSRERHVFFAGTMLAVYGAGMVVSLLIIAALWRRMSPRARSALRGRTFAEFGRLLHVVSMITGVLVVIIGVVFWTTNGLVAAPVLVPASTLSHLQGWATGWSSSALDITVVLVLAPLAIGLWLRRERRRTTSGRDTTHSRDHWQSDERPEE